MKLIHKQTGKVVREGDKVTDYRGEEGIVLGWTKPQSPASTGRITVDVQGIERHCYPSVYSCEWINREDRLEEPQPTPVGGFADFKPDGSSLEVFPSAPIKPIYKDTSSFPSVSTSDQIKQLVYDIEENFFQIQESLNQIKTLLS